jgi:hypothetical protein
MISLALHDPLVNGNASLMDATELLGDTWRRSKRRVGGDWIGTSEITAKEVGLDFLDDFFEAGTLREIRETFGSEGTWRGAVVKMEYTRKGDVFVRDLTPMANAIRSIYTRIGNNVLTNGSGESGAWTVYNGATVTQDATWSSHGTYSIRIVVADTTIRGATVQTGITIAANTQYLLRATLKVTSGSWRVAVNRSDNDESLCFFSTRGESGDFAVNVAIADTNAYAGTAYIRITSEASAGTINVDAMVFQTGPLRAETGWYVDADSIAMYGRKEEILLRSGKSNADANAECQSLLLDRAWVNPTPPKSSQTWLAKNKTDALRLTFAGYWATLNWIYTTQHGTQGCSAWVSALTALQSTYISSGVIESNSMDFFVDDRGPLKVGDLLGEIAQAGASGGAKYEIGVSGERKLNYGAVAQALSYYRRDGRLYDSGEHEIEPWMARPGWALWQDMPLAPGALTANAQHDPRWVFLEEVEMFPSKDSPTGYEIGFKLN